MSHMIDQEHYHPEEDTKTQQATLVDRQIAAYLGSGVSLRRIAELIGAEGALRTIPIKSKTGSDVLELDVQAIVKNIVESERPLHLPESITVFPKTILPPDEGEVIERGDGDGLEKKNIFPRTRELMALLTEMQIPYSVVDGTNAPGMIRERSYQGFYLGESARLAGGGHILVLVNNEEGNATFVAYGADVHELSSLLESSKSTLRVQGNVAVLHYPGDMAEWSSRLRELLEQQPKEKTVIEHETDLHPPREGWQNVPALKRVLQKSYRWVESTLAELAQGHPEWVDATARGLHGRPSTYYAPELVQALAIIAERLHPAQENWLNVHGIADTLGKSENWVKRRIKQLVIEHPAWVDYQALNAVCRQIPHYAPELVAILKHEAETTHLPNEGWIGISELADRVGKSQRWVYSRLPHLLRAHPEWVDANALDRVGEIQPHYAPDLLEELRREANLFHPARPGWIPEKPLKKSLRAYAWVDARLNNLVQAHPEWVDTYALDSSGKPIIYYAPELVQELRRMKENNE